MLRIRRYDTIRFALAATLAGLSASAAAQPPWSEFGPAAAVLDTTNSVAGGCPIESRDERSLYMAADRPGGEGGLDIWVAHRVNEDAAFGLAENLGPPVNSEYADFCPTPVGGKYLFFVSTRPAGPGEVACGEGDMYLTRWNPAKGWETPVNLGCAETGDGPNTAGSEYSPSLVEVKGKTYLYFSSTGYTDTHDLMVTALRRDGSFAPATPVDELNTGHDDRMPNVSKDGLEIVWSSSRPDWGDGQPAFGSFDVYYASRGSVDEPFSAPVNLGPGVNTADGETRSSFSWDLKRVNFGRAGEIYVTKRERLRGRK